MAVAVPPRAIRTLVVTPVVFVGAGIVTILSPLLHLVLGIIDLIDRKGWRFTRVVGLGIAFCVLEFFGLIIAFLLWLASGFTLWVKAGWAQSLHLWVMGWWLELITRALRFFIGFTFEFDFSDRRSQALLVFSRHAGPGDALLLARHLIREQGLELRMLGTTKLLWDPFFNHLVQRLPFTFCDPHTTDPARQLADIEAAAAAIPHDGAMIVFPEGANFTPKRRDRAIARLEERGQHDRAVMAEHLHHVLPPRTAGTLAALDGASHASVMFFAHVGLDDLLSLGDIWRSVPIRRTVKATYWYAEYDRSMARDETIAWLFEQWETVDAWIDRNGDGLF